MWEGPYLHSDKSTIALSLPALGLHTTVALLHSHRVCINFTPHTALMSLRPMELSVPACPCLAPHGHGHRVPDDKWDGRPRQTRQDKTRRCLAGSPTGSRPTQHCNGLHMQMDGGWGAGVPDYHSLAPSVHRTSIPRIIIRGFGLDLDGMRWDSGHAMPMHMDEKESFDSTQRWWTLVWTPLTGVQSVRAQPIIQN